MILVTGGTGLVGSHLLYHLALKHLKICAIYRNKTHLKKVKNVFSYYSDAYNELFGKIEWIKADLEDIPSLSLAFTDVDTVYHCAALISFNPKDYFKMRRCNIKGTANMVNLSIDFKVKKFCYVSSIATLEDLPNATLITENDSWSGAKDKGYAITKYGAEQEVWRGSQEGLKVIIVNPGVIIGPGFWNSGSGQMFTNIYKGFKFYTCGVTGFIGVNDVAKAVIALTENNIDLERFILVSENLSFKQVFDVIAGALKVEKPNIKVTGLLAAIVWRLDYLKSLITRKPPLFTKETAASSQLKTYYSAAKIKKTINFEFENIDKVIKFTANKFIIDNSNF